MATILILRSILVVALAAASIGIASASATARQDAGEHARTYSELNQPLKRIGAQLVRGDNLTGNGVDAPLWVPQA